MRRHRRARRSDRAGDVAHPACGSRSDAQRAENRVGTEPVDFCREIESYLCRKNDGHLIRVTGPSFELVSRWAAQGVPLKVAFNGIDRYFDRYYAKGPRRRPVKIDFCEADVLDVFDEWRRATGVTAVAAADESEFESEPESRTANPKSLSLPAHLERALTRLTSARAGGSIGDRFDGLIDRVSNELDEARSHTHGLRGAARQALIDRLAALDAELLAEARGQLNDSERTALAREADEELRPFRSGMAADALAGAHDAAMDRLVRERFNLPTIAFG